MRSKDQTIIRIKPKNLRPKPKLQTQNAKPLRAPKLAASVREDDIICFEVADKHSHGMEVPQKGDRKP